MRLVSGSQMAEIDRYTINNIGIPGAVLMENAGKGAFNEFMLDYAPEKNSNFLIVCGKGNNGGDGFVIARYLIHNGFKKVKVILLTEPENLKGDAKINYNVLVNFGLIPDVITESKKFAEFLTSEKFDYIFDGILGTGLKSQVREFYKEIIDEINRYNAIKIAIDIPSGLCSEKGVPLGTAIKANSTYTFGIKKIGLSTYPGVLYAGDVKVIDISIPEKIPFEIKNFELNTSVAKSIYKIRECYFHKGNFGHAIILGGSPGFSGAVIMAAKASLKAGCGLSTAIIPIEINEIFESSCLEAMSFPFDFKKFYQIEDLINFINSKNAILIGPGMGLSNDAKNLLFELLPEIKIPVVLDADALNIISQEINILNEIKTEKILTPHPGEFSRLINKSTKEIQNNRLDYAKEFAQKFNSVIVLKGYRTVITNGDKSYISTVGNDALATAGSGDVLGGLIVSFLAQGYSPIESANLGVFLHGLTGEICSKKFCSETVIAGDLIENLHYSFEIIKA